MSIHQTIKSQREARGWSQGELGKRVSEAAGLEKPLSWQAVQQWENGSSAPQRKRLEAVASVFGMKVADLLTEPGEKSPDESSESFAEYVQDVRHSVETLARMLSKPQRRELRNMMAVLLKNRLNLVKLELVDLNPLLSDNSYAVAPDASPDLSHERDLYIPKHVQNLTVDNDSEDESDGKGGEARVGAKARSPRRGREA